ncbi:hypothetical protein BJ166DRAFT_150380 [Pestalotiopsis sp. NC0098]|nr:hypothetical protein BJ166DRAFT_150380 [Pestalotiopsis sp. NC0098]
MRPRNELCRVGIQEPIMYLCNHVTRSSAVPIGVDRKKHGAHNFCWQQHSCSSQPRLLEYIWFPLLAILIIVCGILWRCRRFVAGCKPQYKLPVIWIMQIRLSAIIGSFNLRRWAFIQFEGRKRRKASYTQPSPIALYCCNKDHQDFVFGDKSD